MSICKIIILIEAWHNVAASSSCSSYYPHSPNHTTQFPNRNVIWLQILNLFDSILLSHGYTHKIWFSDYLEEKSQVFLTQEEEENKQVSVCSRNLRTFPLPYRLHRCCVTKLLADDVVSYQYMTCETFTHILRVCMCSRINNSFGIVDGDVYQILLVGPICQKRNLRT